MYWLVSLATFCFVNEYAFSEKLPPSGQISCESRLQCLLLPSHSAPSGIKQEMTPSREINTWYPIPKWKVFLYPHKNRSGYSQPYFNKQNTRRTDGNNIHDNDFSSIHDLKESGEVFGGLNIQFLPLKDGNITVKGFVGEGGKINDSTEEEYVALFVVYAHSINKNIPKTSFSNINNITREVDIELINRTENDASCDDPGGCRKNGGSDVYQINNSNATEGRASPKGDKIVSIAVTKNMSIVMNIGELDNDNYTVMIIPLNKGMNASEFEKGDGHFEDADLINITLTKNMSMVVKSDEIIYDTSNENVSSKVNTSNIMDLKKELPEKGALVKHRNESDSNFQSTDITDIKNEAVALDEDDDDILKTTLANTVVENLSFESDSNFQSTDITDIENEAVTLDNDDDDILKTTLENTVVENSSFSFLLNNITSLRNNTNSESSKDIRRQNASVHGRVLTKVVNEINSTNDSNITKLKNVSLHEQFSVPFNENNNKTKRKKSRLDSYEFEYYKRLGPYEVKQINSSQPPFIATIHITVNNRDIRNKTTYMIHVSSQEINNSDITKSNLTNKQSANSKENSLKLNRRKRSTSNEYLPAWRKLHQRANNVKAEIINNKFISRESQVSNKYISRETKMILSKTNETSLVEGTMNHFDLILPGDNRKEQNNISRSVLFQMGSDSYPSPTISNSNEEFNQKIQDKFRNKGIIANEISDNTVGDDGAESNQTAYGDRNKREVASATLIPNKDPGENHSVLKKSELQIVEEGGSLERHLKMKIPPGIQSLLRNGIKVGKICHVESGCKEMNDVFNTAREARYYKVDDERMESFDSNESLGANRRIDKRNGVHNLGSMRNIKDKSMDLEVNKGSDEKFQIKLIPITQHLWNDLRFLRGLKDSVAPVRNITAFSRLKHSGDRINNYFEENKTSDISNVQFLKIVSSERKEHLEKLQNAVFNKYFDQNLPNMPKLMKSLKKSSVSENYNYLPKKSLIRQKLIRKKRLASEFAPIAANKNSFHARNSSPNQLYLQSVPSEAENNSSFIPKYEEKSDETEMQNLLMYLLQTSQKSGGENTNVSPLNNFRSNKANDWQSRYNSAWPPKSNPAWPPKSNLAWQPKSNSAWPLTSNSAWPPTSNSAWPPTSNSAWPPPSNSAWPPSSNSAWPPTSNSAWPSTSNSAWPPTSNSAWPSTSNSAWPPRSRVSKWPPQHERNQNKSPHGLPSDFLWIIPIPELVNPINSKTIDRELKTPTFAHTTKKPWKMRLNPDREREHEWEMRDWILINPALEKDQSKISSMPKSPVEQKPLDIINKPSPTFRTTRLPARKPVFQTTVNPMIRDNFYTTPRSVINPTFQTTAQSWSYDKPWDYNPWSVSHNPWENQWTTPSMMMMGGMTGGD